MKPGDIYKHFKGGEYKIICIAADSETQADMVVYQSLAGGRIWVRSYVSFTTILEGGVRRFSYLRCTNGGSGTSG